MVTSGEARTRREKPGEELERPQATISCADKNRRQEDFESPKSGRTRAKLLSSGQDRTPTSPKHSATVVAAPDQDSQPCSTEGEGVVDSWWLLGERERDNFPKGCDS